MRTLARTALVGLVAASVLGGCGQSSNTGDASGGAASIGQVAPVAAAPQVSYYAAARFLEQASFGPTPQSIEHVRRIGLAAWIDEQMAMPFVPIDGEPVKNAAPTALDENGKSWYWDFMRDRFFERALTTDEQLRMRVAWALLQYIVVSQNKGKPYGVVTFFNKLQHHAFGNYADLLRAVTIDPSMGAFLDNSQNRPEGACPNCAPNENYARELMQLFSLGVSELNRDGSVVRDNQGKPKPTYVQEDVEELARALTGWDFHWEPNLPVSNWGNFGKPMVPAAMTGAHDSGAKVVMGTTIPAGGSASQDLEVVIGILMNHKNIAPFVSLRLIQHLVTSDPSPDYLRRVATVFENNGHGVRGDLAAVVKAVLLDPEARRGDTPGPLDARVGKLREPVLWHTALLRGMGCRRLFADANGHIYHPWTQTPGNAPSVFSYYLPTDRAPGSGLLAPEQRLVDATELANRVGTLSWIVETAPQNLAAAGCDFEEFVAAEQRSFRELSALISARYLRGAIPPTLRDTIEEVGRQMNWASDRQRAASALTFALASPAFGVMR